MILTDLKQAGGESSRVRKQLRRERVMLMKELAEEAGLELEIEDDGRSGARCNGSLPTAGQYMRKNLRGIKILEIF